MQCLEEHRSSDWLKKALCRRYALVHFTDFDLPSLENNVPRRQRWCWAFGMSTANEFEILGAWRTDTDAGEPIIEDLRNRGVLSIRVASIAEAKGFAPQLSLASWTTALQGAEPRVLELLASRAASGKVVEGVSSASIRSAVSIAGRIQDGLVRGARPSAPFASADAASEFVASWLQKADRRLYDARRPARPVVARAA